MKRPEIHTVAGKKKFIRDLCNRIKSEALSKAGKMPVVWDGHELRVYLADKFEESASMSAIRRHKNDGRFRDYKNTISTATL